MKTASRSIVAALSAAALTFVLAAGCDDSSSNNGADVTVHADVAGGDGTLGNTDGTGGTDTKGAPDGKGGADTTAAPDAKGGTDTTVTPDSGGGTDTTVTPDSNPPAPFCGDEICNGGESQVTCPGDCGGTVTPTALLCFEINGCLAEQCGSLPAAQQNACANAAINAGGACPSATGELPIFIADNQCLAANCAAETTAVGQAACIGEKCSQTQANCNSGNVKGAGTCGALQTCLQSCLVGGQIDAPCARACYSATAQTGLELDVKLNYCLLATCANSPTQALLQQCAQAALNPNGGACAPAQAACVSDGAIVVADPTPDASGDAAGDTADTTTPDAEEDAGPMPDTTPTPDASGDPSGSSGFAPFFGARYLPERYQYGGRF